MLKRLGLIINKKKVQRLVQKLKIQVKSFSKKTRKYSLYRGTVGKIAENKIKRSFKTNKPYTQIITDTTEFKYLEKDKSGTYQIKKLYLNPYLDMYNSEILIYEISKNPNLEPILKALDKAIHNQIRVKWNNSINVKKRQLLRQLTNGKLLWNFKTRNILW
ncbi:hypothetical protein HV819_02405 [Anaerococcus sp. AGMB00486]|uniref:Transposase n=1 Tax=Anaerococcus faecalis TaxID=2742993 RepID=A0ABX2N838_9FIRM|nr:hypothetical protein [Anaerococcus faecalis]